MGPAMRARSTLLAPLLVAFVSSVAAACSTSSTAAEAPPADAGVVDAAPALPALGLNDVSVLVPIPASPSAPGYMKPRSKGTRGELLPQAVYDQVPEFPVVSNDSLEYARMRVVGIRFDGCFMRKTGCEAQIRLVMQPISDTATALDSALHLFYRLTEEELAEVVHELRNLRALAPEQKDAPLDVSPVLVSQGMEGPYAAALRDLVLTHAGEQNLVRMTFFLRAPPKQEEWFFGGFERDAASGTMTTMDIVGVGKSNQRVDHPVTPDGYTYELTPSPTKPEDLTLLLSTEKAKAASRADLEKALGAFARLENPQKHGADDLSCGGCHVTTVVTEHAKAQLGLDVSAQADAFKSTRDLTVVGESGKTTSSLRAFGYFGAKPMIARRLVHETAVVLDDLEQRFPAAK